MRGRRISIWFFIGISLLVNGVLIVGAGVWSIFIHPANPVVLFQYHANIWWGAVLLLVGLFYCLHFAPNRQS